MPSSNEKIRVDAKVTGVRPNGWAIAQVLRAANAGSGRSARPGQTIAVQAKYGKKVGDQFKCDIVPNDRGQDDWFATYCVTSKTREISVNWPPWQGSKENPLANDLPTTVSGTPHDGIKLGCWRCGKLLIDEGHIHRIKETSVWTNSGFDSANFIFDREHEQYNEYKKCKFVPVKCSGCRKSVATLYETQFLDSDTGALMTDEKQPIPCLNVTTLRQPPGETSFEHHTVLLGEEGTVRDAIGSLTTHEIHEINKLMPKLGRPGQDEYATRRALREANGAEIMVDCNVCFVETSSLKGIRCSNTHFTCNDCFGGYISSVCDDALNKGCLDVKCVMPDCAFVFEHHDVCHHLLDPETYDKFAEAGKRLREQKALQEEAQRLEEESQRQLRMLSEEERKINDARKKITEDILTLKCPSCKAAFVDFDGCFALSCKSCPCRFCAGCLAPAKDGQECHRHVSACEVCRKAGVNGYFGTEAQFEQIHKTRRSKLLKEFLERPDVRELAGKVVEAMRKNLEHLNMNDTLASYGVQEQGPGPEPPVERLMDQPHPELLDQVRGAAYLPLNYRAQMRVAGDRCGTLPRGIPMPDVVREPQVRIHERARSKEIFVVVQLPGVESSEDVYAMLSDPTPLRSTLHVRVRGQYSADIQLPAKVHETLRDSYMNYTWDNQWISFTFRVSEPPVERPLNPLDRYINRRPINRNHARLARNPWG